MPYILINLGSRATSKQIFAKDEASVKAYKEIVWEEKVYQDFNISENTKIGCNKVATEVLQILKKRGK